MGRRLCDWCAERPAGTTTPQGAICWPCLRGELCCSSAREAAARGCGCKGAVGDMLTTAGGRP